MKQIFLTPNIKSQLFTSLAERPLASVFGIGQCQIGADIYTSDGLIWTNKGITALNTVSALTNIGVERVGKRMFLEGVEVGVKNTTKKRLAVLGIGNSIASQQKRLAGASAPQSGKYWQEHIIASALAGGAIAPVEMSTFGSGSSYGVGYLTDIAGWYGHGGATSTTILSEVEAELFIPALKSGVIPDFIWIHSLFENDSPNGIMVDTSLANLASLIVLARSYWPKVGLIIATCRVSMSFNTSIMKSNFIDLYNRLMLLEDSAKIFVYDASYLYENVNDKATPKYFTVTGSISATSLVIDSNVSGDLIDVGSFVTKPNSTEAIAVINSGTSQGGVGNYTVINNSNIVASSETLWVHNYVDGMIHPTAKGTGLIARNAAKALNRIANGFTTDSQIVGGNKALFGSSSITGTGIAVGSTVPTGITIAGTSSSIDIALFAMQSGLRITCTNKYALALPVNSGTIVFDGADYVFSTKGLPSIDAFRFTITLKIVSGAEYIKFFNMQTRTTRSTLDVIAEVNPAGSAQLGENNVGFIDNDLLTFVSPTIRCIGDGSNHIAAIRAYLQIFLGANTPISATSVIEIYSYGYEIVQDKSLVATLVGGTVTVSNTEVKQTSKVKSFRRRVGGTVGQVYESARISGTSITFTSTNAADTSAIGYIVD